MSSMEEVIEVFGDAVSGFIMLSVKLQEQNAQPQEGLRPAAKAVVQTSEILCKVGRAKGEKEYGDYEDIQEDIFDCCDEVEKALKKFDPALDILFKNPDRSLGWSKIVSATQAIASHTSRLLLTVYGAEHRRLEMAGYLLLETCAETKPYAMKPEAELSAAAKRFVECVNKTSSDTMVFCTYVQARSKEIEGSKAAQLKAAVGDFTKLNQQLVDTCNSLMKELSQPNRQAFAGVISEIERITREILEIVKPPEELDVYKQIQDLFGKGSMAVGSAARPLHAVVGAGKPDRNVSADDLKREGDEVKRALVPVKRHPTVADRDEVVNNTNKASAQAAKYNDMLADYIASDKQPALKQPLSAAHADMNRANQELVDATNDYLAATGKDAGKKAKVAGPGGGGAAALARKVAEATDRCVAASPTDKNAFVGGARDAGGAAKELATEIDKLAAAEADQGKAARLRDAAAKVRKGVVDTVNAGKQRLGEPGNAAHQAATERGGADTRAAVDELLAALGADKGPMDAATASANLDKKAKAMEAVIDRVNNELAPTAVARSAAAVNGPVSVNDLEGTADAVLRHIKQLREHPNKAPREVADDGSDLHEVADKFAKQLEARGKQVRQPDMQQKLGKASRDIDGQNKATFASTNDYLKEPGDAGRSRALNGELDKLESLVRATMDQVKPKLTLATADSAFAGGAHNAMPQNVTPAAVAAAAEKMKRDNADVKRYDDLSPAALAEATEKTSNDAARLERMLDKYAADTQHAGLKGALAGHKERLEDANRDLVDAAQAVLNDPDDAAAKRRLDSATELIDQIADDIVADILPSDHARAGAHTPAGAVSPAQLERTGKELIDREQKLLAHPDMTPAEVAAASNAASTKAAQFAGELKARGRQVKNAKAQAALARGADDIDKLHDEQHAAVRALLEGGPRDAAAVKRVNDADNAMQDRVRALLDEIRPACAPQRDGTPHSGHVSPADVERQGRATQAKAKPLGAADQLTPKELADATCGAFGDADRLEKMLDAMEAQDDVSPATKAKIKAAKARLHDKADQLVERANDALALGAEQEAPRRALADHVADLHRDIDQIIEDVKPRATATTSQGGTGARVAPAQLAELGKQVQAAANDVKAAKAASPADLAAKTDAASKLAAQFGDAVADRAKCDKRAAVADALKRAGPRIDAANKRMVAASNALAAKPKDARAAQAVDDSANELISVVQDVIDSVAPAPKMASSGLKARGDLAKAKPVSMAQIDRDAMDAAAAVREVKKFRDKPPAETSKDAEAASEKLVALGDDLATKAAQTKNPKLRKALIDGARRIHKGNPALLKATDKYLKDPDAPGNAEDLDGVCDLILADIADVMASIHPTVAIAPGGHYRSTPGREPTGDELAALGERVKERCLNVETNMDNMSPTELAAAGTDALGAADDFRAALVDAKHPQDAALIAQRNKELERALNDALAEPGDERREAALKAACKAMRDAVDDVLGRARPTVAQHSADDAAKKLGAGPVAPNDLAASCAAVIKAAEETQRFKTKPAKATAADADDLSAKAARYAAQIKRLAEQTPNAAQKKRLMDAYRDLNDANEGAVAAANDYLGDRAAPAKQKALDDACENVKRAARAALDAARPRAELGAIPKHTGAVSGAALRDAAEAVKRAVRPLKAPEKLSADEVKDAAEDTGRKAATFLALAKAKAAATKDPAQRKKLNDIVKALEQEREKAVKHANEYIGDPAAGPKRDAVVKSAERVEQLVDEFMGAAKPTASAARPGPGRGLDTSVEAMDAAANAAKRAVRKHDGQFEALPDDDEVVQNANEASEKLAKFIEHVKAKIEATGDPALKSRLNDQLHKLNDDNKALAAHTNQFLANRGDGGKKQQLHDTCAKTIDDIDKTMGRIRDALKPRSFEDRIDEAATDIRDAASNFNKVPKELRDLGLELADLMRRMAECARKGDRQGIIEAARAISAVVKKIQKLARPFGDNCTDPRLKDVVLVGVQALGNFGTQLKILAAVKAASTGPDPAAETQLVACCQGVSSSMRQALYGVQSVLVKREG